MMLGDLVRRLLGVKRRVQERGERGEERARWYGGGTHG
jgi:hypothetical protein